MQFQKTYIAKIPHAKEKPESILSKDSSLCLVLAVPTLSETLALVGRLTEPERAIFVGSTSSSAARSQRESLLLPLLLLSLLLSLSEY